MPREPRIACLCVTQEKRAPIFGPAVASFEQQHYADARLFVSLPLDNKPSDSLAVLHRIIPEEVYAERTLVKGSPTDYTVQARLDQLCITAFGLGFDLVTIWDDDDIKPPTWLDELGAVVPWEEGLACLCGTTQGWFCNLRSFNGEFLQLKHLWGGSLTFNKKAWKAAGGFSHKPWPGYDRAFHDALIDSGERFIQSELTYGKAQAGHVAFSHGDNIATFLKSPGESLYDRLKGWYGINIWRELCDASAWLRERRIFPPFSGGN